MSESFISSLHIQKLGHKLEEIRIRALNHVLSKLDHGITAKNDMSRCLELLKKLFEWFDFDKLSEEEKVFNLIFRILKSEIGDSIVKHVGTVALIRDLKQIRTKVKERQYFLVDRIIQTVESVYDNPNAMPMLISDPPLSYRSGQTVYDQASQHSRPCTANTLPSDRSTHSIIPATSCTFGNNQTPRDSNSFRISGARNSSDRIGTAATTVSGLEYKSTTASGMETGVPRDSSTAGSSVSPIRNMLYKSVPHITMSWQPLVKSDCHVLKSVEESLQNPPQPSVLMHSCQFFCNVMLQDFPAEVFLQRPSILLLFYDMINTCPSTRITNAALICLNKLSENLIIRIKFYSDPCTYNLKQGTSLMNEPEYSGNGSPHRMFDYNIDVSKQVVTESDSDDNELFRCSQISMPQYCIKTFMCILNYVSEKPQSFRDGQHRKKTQSGVNTALQVVDKLVTLTTMCIKSSIWDNQSDGSFTEIVRQLHCLLETLGDVLEQFRLMVVASDMEYFERMAQLHLLHSTSYLLTELVPISRADAVLPRTLKNSLSSSLLDASFGRLYPAAHESLVQYVNVFSGHYETESLTKYKDVQQVCKAMTKAVKILKHSSSTCHVESLQLIFDSLPSLEFHKNLSIINTFLKICVKHNSFFNSDEVTQKLVGDILLAFLSHSDEDIQKETYSLCQKLIVNILGINHTKHISESDPGSQVVFFFRSDVFVELAAHGLTSNSVQIQTYAEDILIHILKCKFLVSESVWRKMIRSIIPAMPIIQCYMSGSTPLGKAIVKIMDPDISPSLFMSTIDVVKGNLRMLFSKDIKLRNEAVSRLCWLLTTEQDANEKVPKIQSLQDCGLSNVFQFEYPIDLSRMKSSNQFYQVSSLQQVLELLSTSNRSIEPAIRRSALNQVSVMLEDHFLHPAFLEQNGLKLVLNILENSLNVHQYHNYPDSVIPAISILKNICLHNAVIRQELALNIDFIFNLLRALFLYCTDKRMQQDGALVCCLLLFSEFAIYSYAGKDIVSFSLPAVIVQKLHMPFKCHTHWKTSRHTKPSLVGLLMTDNWCRSTLRMHWNIEWFGGISELITWSQVPTVSALTPQQLADFSADLRLTKADLLALKASSVVHCCQKYLFDIENATTHLSVLESVRGIAGYIGLWLLAYKSKMYTPDESLMNLSWNSAFSRFLSAPPANNEDQNLLIEILRCLAIMLKLYQNSGKACWITSILQDSTHYLPKLLHVDVKSEHQCVGLELLTLVAECSTLEQHLLDIGIVSGSYQQQDSNRTSRNNNWIHVVQTITDNLKFSDTEQFYNLAYLNKLLACLVQITSNLGWSEVNSHATDFHKLFSELVGALSELLTSFHYGKGAEAASSFMGMSITRNALLTMNHILSEMQHTFKKNWDTYWVSDTICSASLFSLYSLWSCRDVVVRAATLQLLSGLATSARGATIIVETVRQKCGGVWEAALMILIDHSEASIVREHAALLLTNLCSHANVSGSQATLPLCHSPLSANKDMSPMETVLMLLKEYNFFEELDVLLACLHLESTFQPNCIASSKMKPPRASVITTARSYVVTSSESASSHTSDGGVNVFATPSLVKAVASFVSNLLFFAPEQVSTIMEEHALVRSFFRCLSTPSLDTTDGRHLLLYADILEMCSYVCALLTRTVLVSVSCRTMALHTRDCLHVLISLLNPSLYNIHLPHFLYLRNQLWCEIFRLFTALLDAQLDKGSKDALNTAKDGYNILSPLLAECGYEPFIRSIYDSIESETTGLQKFALQALTSLLTMEALALISKPDKINSFSLQHLLDEIKTPRDIYTEDIENLDPNVGQVTSKRTSLESVQDKTTRSMLDTYRNTMIDKQVQKTVPTAKKLKRLPAHRSEKNSLLLARTDVNLMVGADLCKILLRLYEMSNLETNKDNKRRGVIIGALSSLLNTSDEAKKCALEEGLLRTVIAHLKSLHVEVSLHSADSLRKLSDKKKVCPILKEVDSLFGLLTNFVKGNERAKEAASELGLADVTHKYWLWFCLERNMLVNALRMLCTLTSKCNQACQSLTLTNPAPGSGPRKVATSVSLLNVIISLVTKEMELVSRSHDITVLQLSFQLLQSVCSVLECRIILAKSNLFQSLNRLHPALTKRQRPWEIIEQLWLEFLETFTFYPEGQLHVTKTNDTLELILSLTSGTKASNKLAALSVLRNVAFHQSNRIKLLASVEFIQLLHTKLTSGTLDEKNIVVSIIWALVANSQRSKMVIKCAGLDARIQDLIKQYEMRGIHDKTYQTMLYVFAVLKDGDK